MRLAKWLAAPRVQVWFNGICMAVWALMMPITLAFTRDFSTVLWVSFISTWSLFATHLGGWIAALVNDKTERLERQQTQAKLDHIIEHSEDIPKFST